jgi:hypothetical protein
MLSFTTANIACSGGDKDVEDPRSGHVSDFFGRSELPGGTYLFC